MDLRMWTSGPVGEEVRSTLEGLNAESTLENIVPVLEIMWDRKDDTLYVENSTTAISWIRSNDARGTFVGNPVKEICAFSGADQWSYVPAPSNPAALRSRGCSLLQFSESDWWSGSDWLKDLGDRWPKLEIKPDEILIFSELKKGINLNVGIGVTAGIDVKWYEKFSEFSKMIRILGWVKRFTKNCQKKMVNQEPFLSVGGGEDEVQDSRGTLLLLIQAESFPETGDSIKGLLTVRYQIGLRRVKTKIIERGDSYVFRYPVLLPSRHYIVDCLIRDYYLRHAGQKQTPGTSTFLPGAPRADTKPFSQEVSGTVDPKIWTERLN
ncbi:uncharacterized protein TNCT_297541 [Trichonephila clavata]|uniref:Uncharacterized protein n=1 Tax=Trichonephila clavata TaxID=2740835 RepID=A0A8X6GDK3_TRICU|nr:uncharacterized protein TNCT_297541 [Trichonephila clavata]